MRIQMGGHWRNVVGVGEKSGVYVLLDAKTGEFIWNTLIGPGGDQGGMEWRTAFDGDAFTPRSRTITTFPTN